MCVNLKPNNEFYFTIHETSNSKIEYNIGVKAIEEFSSLLILIGNNGGGFNMVFLANDNIINREAFLMKQITEELIEEFKEYEFAPLES